MRETKKNAEHTVAGVYQASSRGFGFLVPEGGTSREDDYFIPPRAEGGAWHGDRVEVRPYLDQTGQGRLTARVTQVLQRSNRVVTGCIRRQNRQVWLQPDNDRLPGPIQVVGKTKGIRAGDKAAVAMTSFGSAKHPPLGMLREVFGENGSREASTAAILYQYEIEPEFPVAVLAQAEEAPQQVDPAALEGRMDLRQSCIITIDGASAKDLDDAVSLERDSEGHWRLGVHIADVSHYVRARTPLDLEAWERGTSVYFADQVIPMLPKQLSNGICSLNPNVDRLALSCFMTMQADGGVLEHQIVKSVIRSAERMTYDDCNSLLAGTDPALAERYADILPMLRDMAGLAAALEKRRRLRGSLDLDTSESYIVCDGQGRPVEVRTRKQGVSEALIESFMLAANECVAEHLFSLHKPAVYRVHEKPSMDKAEGLRTTLAPLGYTLADVDNFSLQKLLMEAKEKPEAPLINSLVLRSLMKARYDVENLGHFGLAAKFYCHFTSPIRRYPDLMVHRILTALLDGRLEGGAEQRLATAAQKAAVQSSERELTAQSAEREIEKLYMAEFMQDHIGQAFSGAVSGVTRFGLFVVLANGVEGFLPAEVLPEDQYLYDELRLTLVGAHTGRTFSYGMPLELVCVAADPGSGEITFHLDGVPAPVKHTEQRKKKERPLPPAGHAKGKGRKNKRSMHVPRQKKGGRRH